MTTMTAIEAAITLIPTHLCDAIKRQGGLSQALLAAKASLAAAKAAHDATGAPYRGAEWERYSDALSAHTILSRVADEAAAVSSEQQLEIMELVESEIAHRSLYPTTHPTSAIISPVLLSEDGGRRLYPAANVQERPFRGCSEDILLEHIDHYDLPCRRADGVFAGGSNSAWVITRREAEAYLIVNQARAARAEKERASRELRELESRIARMGDPAKLPTRATAARRQAAYNRVVNEGGEGFVPHLYTREEYEWTLARIRTLKGAAA